MTSLHQLPQAESIDRTDDIAQQCFSCGRMQRPRRFCPYCGEPFVPARPVAVLSPLPAIHPVTSVVHVPASGPESPQPGVTPPPWSPALLGAARPVAGARLTWVAVDPTTDEEELAALLPGSVAGNHRWPVLAVPGGPVRREPVVLVIRVEPVSLHRGALAARQWSSGTVGPVRLLGAVFITNRSRASRGAAGRAAELLAAGFPRRWVARRSRSGLGLGAAVADLSALTAGGGAE